MAQDNYAERTFRGHRLLKGISHFLHMEAAGGIILVCMAAIALIIANSPLYGWYDYVLHDVYFRFGFSAESTGFDFELSKSLLHMINDGLMAVFFFLIGLEIKREFVKGELSSRSRAILPIIAAMGGMAVPALIYFFINRHSPETISGWAIPAATDIAFALGVLSLLGSRVPMALKVMLMAIAVMDDLGAIIVIALFYSGSIHIVPLIIAAVCISILFVLNRKNVCSKIPYMLIGFIMWAAVLESGVHATLAGVITALFIPLTCKRDPSISPSESMEHVLHPWVAFMVLPVFAFANAGVPFKGMGPEALFEPVTLGIILGLFIGKQLGIFGTMWLAVKAGISPKPEGCSWTQIYAMSILCGIGFTMSLFIGGLAFGEDLVMQAEVRLGVLAGSILSALVGYGILRAISPKN